MGAWDDSEDGNVWQPVSGTASTFGISREVAPVIRGEVEDPGRLGNLEEMGILAQGETRPSGRERDRVIEQINDAVADERLSQEQGTARTEAVMRVERRSDFRHLTRDLPPARPMPGTDNTKSNPAHLMGIGAFMLTIGGLILTTDIAEARGLGWAAWVIGMASYLLVLAGAMLTARAGRRLRK